MSHPPVDVKLLERAEVRALYEITVGDQTRRVLIARLGTPESGQGSRYGVSIEGGPVQLVEATRPVGDVLSLLIEDAAWEAGLVDTDDGYDVEVHGIRHAVEVVDPKRKALRLAAGAAGGTVKTAMPGRIVRVLVAEGDEASKGDPLVVVEAMKMENELPAPVDGTVKRVAVAAGDLVEAGTVLIELG